jgi:exodeoxyribonuclease V beta subunit
LERNTENGERIITNLYQLIELLFKTQSIKNLSPLELIDWLKRGIEEKDATGDELEQRIETDEEAVKIITIHSSKGLQYPIVFAPYLDLLTSSNYEECSYRDETTSEYISALKSQLDEEQNKVYIRQLEQENRRLIYVALTRAIYKCFIYKNTYSKEPYNYANSSLSFFTRKCTESPLITLKNSELNLEGYQYSSGNVSEKKNVQSPVSFALLHKNWNRMSYTMLASHLEIPSRRSFKGSKDDYDNFIFNQLTKGNITGNLLHYIFENIHFSDNSKWPVIIERAIKRFAPGQKDIYETYLPETIEHVLHAQMQTSEENFTLNEINFEKRIHELEFDFPVSLFHPNSLADFTDENISINIKSFGEMEGMMNGKIDLLFENENKYFVLDWKSTYLGGSLKDYDAEALAVAMNENNYHLQYLIYTVAIKKYLESRLPDFEYERDFGGVFYCFVRGMRQDSNNGIFWSKPSLKIIERLEAMFNVKKALLQM